MAVNDTFRRMHFPDESAAAVLGKRLSLRGLQGPWLLAVPVILGLVAALACVVPARGAMRVDPMVALRCE